jgi:hypothetical protein
MRFSATQLLSNEDRYRKCGALHSQPMIEFLLELFGEFFLQLCIEALAEMGLHAVADPLRRPINPWLAALGYAVFGALLGALSLWLFPVHFIGNHTLRYLNLIITPVAVGLAMMWVGMWRAKRGQPVMRLDRFTFGFLFAFALGVTRFVFGAVE